MFFKNLQLFRITGDWAIDANSLHQQLSKFAFAACPSSEIHSQGWISPRNNDLLVHSVNRQYLFCLASEKKLLPSSYIKQVTKQRAEELEEQQGFAPGRKALKELKERVTDELLPRAFPVRKHTYVWLDPVNGWLVVDTTSPTQADEVIKFLMKACDKVPVENLRTKTSPQTTMTAWLAANEAPKGFTIDQDTELKSPNEDKSTVRYLRHTLDHADIKKHIEEGKQSTKLALTWNDRISFVLTDTLVLKRIKPLDVMENDKDKGANEEERFDSDFALMSGELAALLSDLVYALDGLAES